MHVGNHLRLLAESETVLAHSFGSVANRHADQPDIPAIFKVFEGWCNEHVETLRLVIERYPGAPSTSAHVLSAVLFKGPRKGGIGLLRDLQDLHLLLADVHGGWSITGQLAAALRDDDLLQLCNTYPAQTVRQMEYVETRIKELAPQVLVVG
jgi:hypothetical protein